MNIEYLHEFFVLAYRLNFSAAAKELHITQPTLSSHIAALEKELGTTLFKRDSQSVSLTPAGKACLESVNGILANYNDLLRTAKQYGSSSPRKVVIQTYADSMYAIDVVRMISTAPAIKEAAIEIELKNLPRTDFLSDILNRQADIAVVADPYSTDLPERLTTVQLADEPLAAIVSVDSPLASPLGGAGRQTISIKNLDGQKVVVPGMTDDHRFAERISEIFDTYNIAASISEHYYGSIYDQITHIDKDEVYIDTFNLSYNMTPLSMQSYKIMKFEEEGLLFRDVGVYRKDSSNPCLGMVIDELKKM